MANKRGRDQLESATDVPRATAPAPKRQARSSQKSSLETKGEQVTSLDPASNLNLNGGDAYYVEDFVDPADASAWYKELLELDSWYQPKLKVYGKEVTQSREIAAYATKADLNLKYSGQVVQMRYEYPPLLREIQDKVEKKLGVTFNHCMLNKYDNGTVYIGNHRDNKENRVIASLSLGAPRTFIMTHTLAKKSPVNDPRHQLRWQLANGSLVVMQGDTQKNYKHEIPKEPKIKEGRISLTFRQLVY